MLSQKEIARHVRVFRENFQVIDRIICIAEQNDRKCDHQNDERANSKPLTSSPGKLVADCVRGSVIGRD